MKPVEVKELADKYGVTDVPGASIPGSRLANILVKKEAGKPLTEQETVFLQHLEKPAVAKIVVEVDPPEMRASIPMKKTLPAEEKSNTQEKRAATNFVLIDFENVQPDDLMLLQGGKYKVLVFVGSNQKSLPFAFADAMQQLGSCGEYVKISGNGKNALDFHIAYYIGRIISRFPNVWFHVISKDKGYDPLVKHLKSDGIKICRRDEISLLPQLKKSVPQQPSGEIQRILQNLKVRGKGKPGTKSALLNTIKSILQPQKPSDIEVELLFHTLKSQKYVREDGKKILYNLQR